MAEVSDAATLSLYVAARVWPDYGVAVRFEQGHFSKPSAWLNIVAQK